MISFITKIQAKHYMSEVILQPHTKDATRDDSNYSNIGLCKSNVIRIFNQPLYYPIYVS